jgi:hypothetical protein
MIGADRVGEFGAIYLPALQRIRNLWMDLEPLVETTGYDAVVEPTELRVELADGIETAESAHFDIRWSELEMYSFHYVDTLEINWRFDRHPNPHSSEKHFRPPPAAATATAEPSCIRVEEVSLVTRAVYTLWRLAYETEDLARLNNLSNPP